MKINNHRHILIKSLRISFISMIGFIIYEALIKLEKKWNKNNPGHEKTNLYKRYTLKFIILFIVAFIILYIMYFLTNKVV